MSDAVRLLLQDRRARRFVVRPLFIAFLAWGAVLFAGNALLIPPLELLFAQRGLEARFVGIAGRIGFTVLWALVSGPVFYALATAVSGFFWEGLSRHAEGARYGTTREDKRGFVSTNAAMSLRIAFAVTLGIVSLLFGLFGCMPVAAALAGLAAMNEVFDAPLARRGLLFPRTFAQARRTPGSGAIWLAASAASLVPVVNVLALPVFVAAATYAVNEAERGAPAGT